MAEGNLPTPRGSGGEGGGGTGEGGGQEREGGRGEKGKDNQTHQSPGIIRIITVWVVVLCGLRLGIDDANCG